MDIKLSTKAGYPATFITSGTIKVEGWDAFIFIDFSNKTYASGEKATGEPTITLTSITISAHKMPEVPVQLVIGDKVTIGNVEYELTCKKTRYIGNGDIKLTPVK